MTMFAVDDSAWTNEEGFVLMGKDVEKIKYKAKLAFLPQLWSRTW